MVHYKIQITLCLLFFMAAISHSFFLQSRDIRRMLRFFPKVFEIDANPKPHSIPYRDDYDNYDRYDSGDNRRNTARNSKGKTNEKYDSKHVYTNKDKHVHYHSKDCDHPDHRHERYPEDRLVKYQNRNKYASGEDDYQYQNNKRYYQEKKKLTSGENEYEEMKYKEDAHKKESKLNYNKDYISGVLVTVPKIKNGDDVDLDSYYKENRRKNVFLHHLLKTEDEGDPGQHYHHVSNDDSHFY